LNPLNQSLNFCSYLQHCKHRHSHSIWRLSSMQGACWSRIWCSCQRFR